MAPLTLALAGSRLRAARGRPLAVVVALGVAAIIPVVVAASAAVTANAALERALETLPAGQRSVIVAYNALLDDEQAAQADATVRKQLLALGAEPVRRQLEFRERTDGAGTTFTLGATDGLANTVRLLDGRLPRVCTPSSTPSSTPSLCEVVVEKPAGTADPKLGDLGLVVVGHVARTDPVLLSGTFAPDVTEPLVLADGVQGAAAIAPLALIERSYGWVAPLSASVVSADGVDGWSQLVTAAADRLAIDLSGAQLIAPDAALAAESDRAQASAGRFGLLAGSCAALLLGAALVGGAALRPDHARFVSALRRRGLSAGRIRGVLALETFSLALAGLLVGVVAGFAVAAGMAERAGLPVVGTAGTAVAHALPGVLALAAAAWALLVLSLWPGVARSGYADQRAVWRAVSAGAAGGLVAVLLVVSRGSSRSQSGGDSANDPLVVVLPALVLLTLGLATARLWPWALRLAYRVLPRRAPGLRLGISGISARPLLAASTVALLAAGVGACGFAASYRSTLLRGAQDQAAFGVPFDARIQPGTGTGLVPVLSRASVHDYAQAVPGATVAPILRSVASIRTGPQSAEVVEMLGLDPGSLPSIQRWSRVVGGPSPASVAADLAVPAAGLGLRLPAGDRLTVHIGDDLPGVVLSANLRAPDGTERTLNLVQKPGPLLTARLPAVPSGNDAWYLGAITVQLPSQEATRLGHVAAEGGSALALPSGRIDLDGVLVGQSPVSAPWSGWTGAGLKVRPGGAGARLDFTLTTGVLVISAAPAPLGTAASRPLPVAADPVTAAQGPLITLMLDGNPVQATVTATLPRMSTVTGRFVLADRQALAAVVDSTQPGQGQPGELWLTLPRMSTVPGSSVAQARNALSTGAFAGGSVQWRTDIERSLRTDPVARGAVQLLILAAALTMLVALAALVLLVASERIEDAGELYTWEAGGVTPAVLRRGLWARAALVALVAVPAGVVGGLVLTRLTARLVGLTAGGQQPQPPLVAVTGLGTLLPAIALALVVALSAAGAVAAAALREPRPVLPSTRGGAG